MSTSEQAYEFAASSQNLSKKFGQNWALSGIDLKVPKQSFYALIGPNGAGKSTTLKMLLGLINPSGGAANVLGRDSARLKARDFSEIAYVAESQLLPTRLTVKQFFNYCRDIHPTWDESLSSRFKQMFQLPEKRRLSALSRGMRTKAAMLSALAFRPQLLVLDEPFSGLDAAVREDLTHGILELSSENPMTVIFASHDLTEVERLADHVGYLESGKIGFQEPTEQLLARHRQIEIRSHETLPIPNQLPPHWQTLQQDQHCIRFMHKQFSEDYFSQELKQVFPNEVNIDIRPVDLNQIFIAIQRSRKQV